MPAGMGDNQMHNIHRGSRGCRLNLERHCWTLGGRATVTFDRLSVREIGIYCMTGSGALLLNYPVDPQRSICHTRPTKPQRGASKAASSPIPLTDTGPSSMSDPNRIQRIRRHSKRRLLIESLELRQLLAVTPVQMNTGADHSFPVNYVSELNGGFDTTTFAQPTAVLSRDIHGQPIDFNKDGFQDVIFLGSQVDQLVGYYSTSGDPPLLAGSRYPNAYVGFGSLGGLIIEDGNGALGGAFELPGISFGSGGAVLDADGDGYQDLFVHQDGRNRLYIFDPATNSFSVGPSTSLATGNDYPGKSTLADFNNDGAPDLVWPVRTETTLSGEQVFVVSGFRIFPGVLDSGTWNGAFDDASPIQLDVGPIPITFLGSSAQTDSPQYSFPDITGVARDFDRDGDVDLALPTNTGIRMFSNPGNGAFDPTLFVDLNNPAGVPGLFLTDADFNGDGLLDLVSSPNSNASLMYPDGQESLRVDAPIGVYLNTSSSGTISMQATSFDDSGGNDLIPGPITVSDFNLDGHPDLLIAPAVQENTVYAIGLGDGTGTFESVERFIGYTNFADPLRGGAQRRTIAGIAAADFNADGLPDVLSLATMHQLTPVNSQNYAMSLFGISYNSSFTLLAPASELPDGQELVPYSAKLTAKGETVV